MKQVKLSAINLIRQVIIAMHAVKLWKIKGWLSGLPACKNCWTKLRNTPTNCFKCRLRLASGLSRKLAIKTHNSCFRLTPKACFGNFPPHSLRTYPESFFNKLQLWLQAYPESSSITFRNKSFGLSPKAASNSRLQKASENWHRVVSRLIIANQPGDAKLASLYSCSTRGSRRPHREQDINISLRRGLHAMRRPPHSAKTNRKN